MTSPNKASEVGRVKNRAPLKRNVITKYERLKWQFGNHIEFLMQ